jgi:type I restriction enzyme S subunit
VVKLLEQSYFFTWINSISIDENWINAEFYRPDIIEIEDKFAENMNLRIFKLNQIADVNRVTGFEVEKYLKIVEEGIPYLRVKNIDVCCINFDDMQFIPEEVHAKFNKSQFKANDIALTITGRVGTAAIISGGTEFNACQDVVKISIKKIANVNPYYLVVYLNTRYNYRLLNRFNSGGSRPRTLINNVREVNIPIPSPEIQKYIGDKVRRAEELREEAKKLKKEAEEIINESLNIKQLDVLFEGSKVKFEWASAEILTDRIDANYYEQKYVETINHIKKFSKKYITLNSIIDSIYTGKKPIYYEKGIEAYFVQSGNISSNFLELDNKEKVDLSKYNQILFGDLLIAKDGETIGKIAINLTNETVIINEHTYCVRLKEEYKYYSAYIYYFLTNKYINPLIRREATGSAQKGLNFTFTENIIIPILEEDKIMNLYNLELRRCNNIYKSKQLIQEAKRDVEDLIEGNFDMSKVKANS